MTTPNTEAYDTHTGLALRRFPEGEDWFVTLTGDRTKQLFKGSEEGSLAVFEDVRSHYEERRKEEQPSQPVQT